MKSPGIDVRPLRQMTGVAALLRGVLSTMWSSLDDQRVGEINGGWGRRHDDLYQRTHPDQQHRGVIASTRSTIWPGKTGGDPDPVLRQELVQAYIGFELVKYLGWRQITAISQGRPSGPESSVAKLGLSRMLGTTGDLIMSLQAPAAPS